MITAIIVDDEQDCISNLQMLLEDHCSHSVQINGAFQSVEEGVQAIKKVQPELVFLDIEIKGQTAFDLLKKFPIINFEIIFTTAHNKYAVQAFRLSAIDYLLKPIRTHELVDAVDKIKNKFSKDDVTEKFNTLFHNLQTVKNKSKKICLPVLTGFDFVLVDDIIRCEGNINYTNIFMRDKKKYVVSKPLKDVENLLSDCDFFRVHHSYLINLNRIKNYNKGRGGFVIMEDGKKVEVSTRKRDDFLKRIATL